MSRLLNLTLCAISTLAIAGSAAATNLINNGDFANTGNVFVDNTGFGGDDLQYNDGTSIPGWTNVTPPGAAAKYVNDMWIQPTNSYSVTASPGNGSGYFVDLTGEGNAKPYGGLQQTFATVSGVQYKVSFALGYSTLYNGTGTAAAALTATVKGTIQLATHHYALNPTSTNQWTTESFEFTANSATTTLQFLADSAYTSRYVGLDNVSVAPQYPTATTLTASTTAIKTGQSVSLTALVKPTIVHTTPTGSVIFKSGAQNLGTVTLNGTGQATLATTALAAGNDSVTAVYLGDSNFGASTSTAQVIGVGTPVVKLSASALAFGNQATGASSASKSLTLSNAGFGTLNLSTIALSGAQADDFILSKTCGSTLAAGAACTLTAAFKPVSSGAKSATVMITDNAAGSPQSIALSGTGTAAGGTSALKLSTTSLSFGTETVAKTSAAQTVTLTNSGSVTLTVSAIALTGGQADDYALTKTCGATLAPNAACTLTVTFKPVSAGLKNAAVSLSDNAAGSPQSITLAGTGSAASTAPVVHLSATSMAFGSQSVGVTSTAHTATLTNSGTAALTSVGVALTGGQADDYALSTTCPSSLAANATCVVSVTFKPVSTGAKLAAVTISDNAAGSPQSIGLTGAGK